jgi:acetyl-CoA/propionyl-CoA carboxylase biotin carboxyl carrier protein
MLSKIVAWGPDRNTARRTLRHALGSTTILGVTTNVGFLREILEHAEVISGHLDTGLMERVVDHDRIALVPREISAAAALITLLRDRHNFIVDDPWKDPSGWRIGGPAWTTYRARLTGHSSVSVRHRGSSDGFDGSVDEGPSIPSAITIANGIALIVYGGVRSRLAFAHRGRTLWFGSHGETWSFTEDNPTTPGGSTDTGHSGAITSPMPGTISATPASSGEFVTAGQAVVIVEAIKMEHTLRVGFDGIVTKFLVAVGDRVALNQQLAVIEPIDDASNTQGNGDR